jgi:hypothetical protein
MFYRYYANSLLSFRTKPMYFGLQFLIRFVQLHSELHAMFTVIQGSGEAGEEFPL